MMMFAKAVKNDANRATLYYESCLDGFLEAVEQLERRSTRLLSAHSKISNAQLKPEDVKAIQEIIGSLKSIRGKFGSRRESSLAALLSGNRIKAGLAALPGSSQRSSSTLGKEAETVLKDDGSAEFKESIIATQSDAASNMAVNGSYSNVASLNSSLNLAKNSVLSTNTMSQLSHPCTPYDRAGSGIQAGSYAGYLASLSMADLVTDKVSIDSNARYNSEEATQECISGSGAAFGVTKYGDLVAKMSGSRSSVGTNLASSTVNVPDGALTLSVDNSEGLEREGNAAVVLGKVHKPEHMHEEMEVLTQLTEPTGFISGNTLFAIKGYRSPSSTSPTSAMTSDEEQNLDVSPSVREGASTQSPANHTNYWGERSTSVSLYERPSVDARGHGTMEPSPVKTQQLVAGTSTLKVAVETKTVNAEKQRAANTVVIPMEEQQTQPANAIGKRDELPISISKRGSKRSSQDAAKKVNDDKSGSLSTVKDLESLPYVSCQEAQPVSLTVEKVVKKLKAEQEQLSAPLSPQKALSPTKGVSEKPAKKEVAKAKKGAKLAKELSQPGKKEKGATNKTNKKVTKQKVNAEVGKKPTSKGKPKVSTKNSLKGSLLLSYTGKRRDDVVQRLMKAAIYYERGSNYFDYLDDPKDEWITHLIAPSDIQRPTLKILYALCQEAYILTQNYLDDAEKTEQWPVEELYEHPRWPSKARRPLASGLMAGIKFHLIGKGKKLGPSDVEHLARLCGASVVKTAEEATHCVIPDGADPAEVGSIQEHLTVVTENWFIGVINGMQMLPSDVPGAALTKGKRGGSSTYELRPSKIVKRESGKQASVHRQLESLSTSESLF